MKSIHVWMPVVALFCSTLLVSCGGSYTDPLDGQQKKWECGDNPTPEEARTKFKALEEHKGNIDMLLAVLRRCEPTPATRANIDLCLAQLQEIADGKARLTSRM